LNKFTSGLLAPNGLRAGDCHNVAFAKLLLALAKHEEFVFDTAFNFI
jgi:hypothetical protein